ncbi:MAG: hypothetical protein QCI82_10880 [Candidatus Thermoplasmatota archaeon]|nr:hypothetical protein [Candidatus Thermoplasmatota archaeon]
MRNRDPLPRYGSRPGFNALVPIMLVALMTGAPALAVFSYSGGYSEVQRLATIRCLGCLGLDPQIPGFTSFWTEYPQGHIKKGEEVPHPRFVTQVLDSEEVDLLILFYWAQGCVPCSEQWDEMVEEGIASGPEDGGREGTKYAGLRLYSIDANEDPNGLYPTYIPTGRENGVPMTTFIFRMDDDIIRWYSHYGKMEVDDVSGMMDRIMYGHISHG